MAFSKLSAFFLSTCLLSQVFSTPIANIPEELADRSLSTCQVVSDIVNKLHNPTLIASATKFCSSFISIPLHTASSVSTTITTPVPVTTTLTESASTTITVTSTLGLPLNTAPPAVKEKRGATLPPYLAAYASTKVSAACSCLSITPATTTIKSTATLTASASIVTVHSTTTSTATSTSTVLGVAPQCLPASINSSPVSLSQPGQKAIAGTAQQVGSRFPINSVQDCCSACYLDTRNCVAFSYGNFDNDQITYPPVLDNPSTTNTCRIYRDVFGDCAADVAVFDTYQQPLGGEVNNFGIGPCTPDLS